MDSQVKTKKEIFDVLMKCYIFLSKTGRKLPFRQLVKLHNQGLLYYATKEGNISEVVIKLS